MRLKYLSVIPAAGILLTGCLKERGNNFANQKAPAANTVYFINQQETGAFEISNTPSTYTFYVEQAASTNANSEATITIAKNTQLVTSTHVDPDDPTSSYYEFLPDSAYQLVNTTAAVDPVTHRAAFQLKVFSNKINLNHVYAVGYTLAQTSDGSTIASNKKTIFIGIGAKNRYDGVYHVTGPMTDVTTSALTNWQPYWVAYLVTTGPNTVDVYDETYTGGVYHPIMSSGSPSYYGSFGMQVTWDLTTNKAVSMKSPYEPAANTRTARLDPNGVNQWDPATHNIRIKYFMFQPSVVASGPRVTFDETWTYIGPRP